MASLEIIVHASSGRYAVTIGAGVRKKLPEIVGALSPQRVAVVADQALAESHLPTVASLVPGEVHTVTFPGGEGHKNLASVARLLEFLAERNFTRSDLVVALGGGITGDVAGFTAATYLRGIRVIQMPTTFLSAIDSSVGGKTGVNLPQGKNLCGAFWQPSAVLCDVDFLQTLPRRILLDGVAEAVKCGMIRDEALFELLEKPDALETSLEEVIARCVALKADVVAGDEFDRGDRALLNFGHTIGHAVEKCTNFAIPHGQAVAIGMVRMTQIAEAQGWCAPGCAERLCAVLRHYELPTEVPGDWQALLATMAHDKKRSGDTLTIVTPERIGHCVRRTIALSEWGRL